MHQDLQSPEINALKEILQENYRWKDTYTIENQGLYHFLFPISRDDAEEIGSFLTAECIASDIRYSAGYSRAKNRESLYINSDLLKQFASLSRHKPKTIKEKKVREAGAGNSPIELENKENKQVMEDLHLTVRPFERDDIHFGTMHADEKGVYGFIPIINGDPIGTDNTCKSLLAIQAYFGRLTEESQGVEPNAQTIQRYIDALQLDLRLFEVSQNNTDLKYAYADVIRQKQSRLAQLKRYQQLNEMISDPTGSRDWGSYPESIQKLIGEKKNCISISLSPLEEDGQVGVDPKYALFSVTRGSPRSKTSSSGLGYELRKMLGDSKTQLMERKSVGVKNIILARAAEKYRTQHNKQKVEDDKDLDALKGFINVAYQEFVDQSNSASDKKSLQTDQLELDTVLKNHTTGQKIDPPVKADRAYLLGSMRNVDKTDNVEVWASSLLGTTVPDAVFSLLENEIAGSPFNERVDFPRKESKEEKKATPEEQEIDKFSIRCQMFLAIINIFCYEKNWSTKNFGQVIEKTPELRKNLLNQIQRAINSNLSIEDTILTVVNDSLAPKGFFESLFESNNPFGLTQVLSNDDKENIKKRFNAFCNTTIESPHYDEFIVFLEERPGPFYIVNNTIALSLEEFVCVDPHPQFPSVRQKFYSSWSSETRLPPIPENKHHSHRMVKKGLNPEGLVFTVNLTQLLSQKEDPTELITQILTNRVSGTGRKVAFDENLITEAHRQQIIHSQWWPKIRTQVAKNLSKSEMIEFLQWKHSDLETVTVRIPTEMEEWLCSYTKERTGNEQALMGYSGEARIKQAFKLLSEIRETKELEEEKETIHVRPRSVVPSNDTAGGYFFTFPKKQNKAFLALEQEYRNSRPTPTVPLTSETNDSNDSQEKINIQEDTDLESKELQMQPAASPSPTPSLKDQNNKSDEQDKKLEEKTSELEEKKEDVVKPEETLESKKAEKEKLEQENQVKDLENTNNRQGNPLLIEEPDTSVLSSKKDYSIYTRFMMFATVGGITVWSFAQDALATHSITALTWATYLAHWNLIFITLYQGLELIRIYQAGKDLGIDTNHPQALKDARLAQIRAVGLNVSLLVTGSFWICSLLDNPHLSGVSSLNILAHSLPALLYLADILINKLKFPPANNKCESVKKHCIPTALFAFSYIIFNATYTVLGGNYGQSTEVCLDKLLDWHNNPLMAVLYSTVGIVALTAMTAFTTLFFNALYSTKPAPATSTPIISANNSQTQFPLPTATQTSTPTSTNDAPTSNTTKEFHS